MTEPHDHDSRASLPIWQLVTLSIYWFGIVIIWGGLNKIILPAMIEDQPGGAANLGILLAILVTVGVIAPILVQPTVGMISDYTVTRWGRRKPYIFIGALLDVVFLFGIATSQTYLSLVAFYFLLQLSSNFAQGPFQGYVPGSRPEAPGRAGERADGDDDRPRHDRRGRDRHLRGEHRQPLRRDDGARRGRAGHDDRARHHRPRGHGRATADPVVARRRPLRLVDGHPA